MSTDNQRSAVLFVGTNDEIREAIRQMAQVAENLDPELSLPQYNLLASNLPIIDLSIVGLRTFEPPEQDETAE